MKSNSSLCTKLKAQLKQQIKEPAGFRNFLPRGTTEIKILYGQMEKGQNTIKQSWAHDDATIVATI